MAIFVQPMQPPLEQPLRGCPTGPIYVTLVESTLFDGIFYLVLRGTMSGHQFGHKERQKSRMSVIIFKILIYVHVSMKGSMTDVTTLPVVPPPRPLYRPDLRHLPRHSRSLPSLSQLSRSCQALKKISPGSQNNAFLISFCVDKN